MKRTFGFADSDEPRMMKDEMQRKMKRMRLNGGKTE